MGDLEYGFITPPAFISLFNEVIKPIERAENIVNGLASWLDNTFTNVILKIRLAITPKSCCR